MAFAEGGAMTCSKVLSEWPAVEGRGGVVARGLRVVVQVSVGGMLIANETQQCVDGIWVVDRATGLTRSEARVLVDFLEGVVW